VSILLLKRPVVFNYKQVITVTIPFANANKGNTKGNYEFEKQGYNFRVIEF